MHLWKMKEEDIYQLRVGWYLVYSTTQKSQGLKYLCYVSLLHSKKRGYKNMHMCVLTGYLQRKCVKVVLRTVEWEWSSRSKETVIFIWVELFSSLDSWKYNDVFIPFTIPQNKLLKPYQGMEESQSGIPTLTNEVNKTTHNSITTEVD